MLSISFHSHLSTTICCLLSCKQFGKALLFLVFFFFHLSAHYSTALELILRLVKSIATQNFYRRQIPSRLACFNCLRQGFWLEQSKENLKPELTNLIWTARSSSFKVWLHTGEDIKVLLIPSSKKDRSQTCRKTDVHTRTSTDRHVCLLMLTQ